MLRAGLDARFVIYHHVVRRRVSVTLDGHAEQPFAALLDARWQARLDRRRLFVNEQVLTILRRPARGKTGWPERIRRRLSGAGQAPDPADLRALDAAAVSLAAALDAYGARHLGLYDTPAGSCSEPLEMLSALYNGEMRPVRLPGPNSDLGHHIPYARVSFGLDDGGDLGASGDTARSFVGAGLDQGLSRRRRGPGMFDEHAAPALRAGD